MKIWSYSRPFTFHGHSCEVKVTLTHETISSLYVDDLLVDEQSIKYIDGLITFIHPLQTSSGFGAEVQSGYFNWWNVGVAVTENGRLVHESHPGENLRYGEALIEDLNGMKESAGEARARRGRRRIFIVDHVTLYSQLVRLRGIGSSCHCWRSYGLVLLCYSDSSKWTYWAVLLCLAPLCWLSPQLFLSFYKRKVLGTNEEHGAGAIHGCAVYGRRAIETGCLLRRKIRALHAGFAASQSTCHRHEYCGHCVCKWELCRSRKFLGRFLAYVHHFFRPPHFYALVFCDSSMGAQV